jgi:hypothetical protein
MSKNPPRGESLEACFGRAREFCGAFGVKLRPETMGCLDQTFAHGMVYTCDRGKAQNGNSG